MHHIGFCILLLLWMTFSCIMILFQAYDEHSIIPWISHSLFIFSLCGFIWLPAVRFWHIWYDMKYVNIITSRQWKDIITNKKKKRSGPSNINNTSKTGFKHVAGNSDSTSRKESGNDHKLSWFIENKQFWGNYRITLYRIVYPMIFSMSCLLTICARYEDTSATMIFVVSDVLFRIFVCLPYVCLIALYIQLKYFLKFEDNFSVGKELRVLFWCVMVNIFFFATSFILSNTLYILKDNSDISTYENTLVWVIWYFILMLVTVILVTTQVWFETNWVLNQVWPLLKNRKFSNKYNNKTIKRSIVHVGSKSPRSKSVAIGYDNNDEEAARTGEFMTVKLMFALMFFLFVFF